MIQILSVIAHQNVGSVVTIDVYSLHMNEATISNQFENQQSWLHAYFNNSHC